MTMKTTTKLASISLFALLLAAAACGDKKPPNPPTASTGDGGDTTSTGDGGDTSSGEGGAMASGDGGGGSKGTDITDVPKKDCHKDMFAKYKAEGFAKVNDSIIKKAVEAPEDKVGPTFKKLAKDKKAAERVKTNLLAF